MDKNDRMFTSKQVDEQIDQLLGEQPSPLSEQALINDLQRMYQDDERSLEKVWQRLGLESGLRTGAERQPETLRPVQLATQSSARKRKHTLGRKHQMHQESQSSIARNLSLIAATLIAALIVGSMLWVFNLSHHNTGPASHRTIQQRPTAKPDLAPGLYISDQDSLFRLDPQTRRVLWQLPLKMIIKIVPAGKVVYVLLSRGVHLLSTVPNAVYAIDANTGSIRWTHTFAAPQLDTRAMDMLLAEDRLYISIDAFSMTDSDSGQIYVLNALDGKQLGVYANFRYIGVIAIGDGILGVGADNSLRAYDTISGKLLWHVFIKAPTNSPVNFVRVVNGLVYAVISTNNDEVGEGQSYIIAYKARTSEQVWKSPIFPGDALYSFTVDRSTLYFGTSSVHSADKPFEGSVYAYDVSHNQQLWSRDVPGGVGLAPIVSGGVVYVAADGGDNFPAHVVALTAGKGDILWQQQVNDTIVANFCVSHGVFYGSDNSAYLSDPTAAAGIYALNAQNGSKLWKDTQHFALYIVPTD